MSPLGQEVGRSGEQGEENPMVVAPDGVWLFHHRLEAAVDHALHVKRHLLGRARFGRLFHYPGVDPVAVGAGFEHNVGKDHGFAGLQLHHPREGRAAGRFEIVAHAFLVVERAVFGPEPAAPSGHPAIEGQLLLRNRQDVAVDVAHLSSIQWSGAGEIRGGPPRAGVGGDGAGLASCGPWRYYSYHLANS